MRKKKREPDDKTAWLFELPPSGEDPEPTHSRILYPVWTQNKARLTERYLHYFVLITHHGTYIDGFAGPQSPDKPETWAAKLVLESKPDWIRNVYLFERDARKAKLLQGLKGGASTGRTVEVFNSDFNRGVVELLSSGRLKQTEAAFCLLDQHTFECEWSTVIELARYKTNGYKIELFYFLAEGWLGRALAAQKDTEILRRWWGNGDLSQLRRMSGNERARLFASRFRKELGYASATPWPVYKSQAGGTVMYFMIHATDHPEGPKQMRRAYRNAVVRVDPEESGWLPGCEPTE